MATRRNKVSKATIEDLLSHTTRNGECMEWQRQINAYGYGVIHIEGGRYVQAHRLAWILTNGEIPAGMLVCHTCDNPSCVNPDHLFLGTHLDNMRDKETKKRGVRVHGEANHNAKLTEEQVREIRAMYSTGFYSYATLAIKFAVSNAEIRRVVHRITWRES